MLDRVLPCSDICVRFCAFFVLCKPRLMPSDRWTGGGSLFDLACLKLLSSCCDSAVVCADLISATVSGQKADLLWNFHSM